MQADASGVDTAALAPDSVVARIAPRPLLLIHGERDRLIPVDHAERLNRRAAAATTDLWTLPGLGHTDGVRMGRCHATPSPMRGEFVDRVTSFFTEWYGWAAFHPDTAIYDPT